MVTHNRNRYSILHVNKMRVQISNKKILGDEKREVHQGIYQSSSEQKLSLAQTNAQRDLDASQYVESH